MEPYWGGKNAEGHVSHPVKYESEATASSFPYCTESSLNFSTSATTYSEDDAEYSTGRRNKTSRQDPLSHRIIEKRRRDRMNSCLADLSRLIPPQYQRKGRGRIEKTEIIEMAIRHLKHLQSECVHKEIEYKLGYNDCIKEAAKFLYDSHMEDFCYRLISHLQEHCDDIRKGDCIKSRCPTDNVSASSGSPHNSYHPAAPLSQLRDILASDIEHSNSNDHNDVKDLSFRNQPHQAAVITSTAPASIHHDSSNHDFDSSREPLSHHDSDVIHSPPHPHTVDSILQAVRLRNFSESSHDVEHNNNYKYKNHIKERFNQDIHSHDESTNDHYVAPLPALSDRPLSVQSKEDGNEHTTPVGGSVTVGAKKRRMDMGLGAIPNDIKSEVAIGSKVVTTNGAGRHFAVPIFALHGQGTYYVPLNMDYNTLLPYLNGIDLLDKSFCPMPVMHPININVNFNPPTLGAKQQQQQQQQQQHHHQQQQMGQHQKAKVETNGW